MLVELEAFENKVEILKRRGALKGTGIVIDDDFTDREKQIQEWIQEIAREEREEGKDAKAGYAKIRVDGEWHEWSERRGTFSQMNFRGEQGGRV